MFHDFISLFFPHYCLTCTKLLVKSERFICTSCFYEFPQTNYHKEVDNPVARKFYGRVAINYAMAFYRFRKGSKVQKLLHQLKYGNKPVLGEIVGSRYGTILKENGLHKTFDLIMPVPLHISRLRKRGYNQSVFFAKGLSGSLGIPWHSQYLNRVKKTLTQTKKDRITRLQNVENAFYIHTQEGFKEKHVLLVDDLITTGATLEACIQSMHAHGIQTISIAAIAVAE